MFGYFLFFLFDRKRLAKWKVVGCVNPGPVSKKLENSYNN